MSAEGLTFAALILSIPLSWAVSIVLIVPASRRPRIRFLSVMTTLSVILSILLTAYVWAVFNAAAGYVVSAEVAKTALRICFLALPFFQIWFLFLYITGRFKDSIQ